MGLKQGGIVSICRRQERLSQALRMPERRCVRSGKWMVKGVKQGIHFIFFVSVVYTGTHTLACTHGGLRPVSGVFQTGSLTKFGTHCLASKSPGSSCLLPPSTESTGVFCHLPFT